MVSLPGSFEVLYQAHAGRCLAVARRVLRDRDLAEEVVQEVFLALWRSGGAGYRPDRGGFEPWLAAVTHHKAVDAVRAAERQRRTRDAATASLAGGVDTAPAAEDQALARLRSRQVQRALTELPAAQRQVLALAYFAGMTQAEIAARTGLALGTIKTRTRSALQRLRAELPELDSTTEPAGT